MKAKNVLRSMLVVVILAVVFAVPASADKPEHNTVYFESDSLTPMCGVEVPTHLEGKFEQIYWFDRYGEDRGDSYHLGGTYISYTYNGHTMTLKDGENLRWYWVTWYDAILEIRGASWIGTLPGHGAVTGTVGKQVILETCHEEGEDWVCEYIPLDLSGMVFDNPEAVCDYLLYGN